MQRAAAFRARIAEQNHRRPAQLFPRAAGSARTGLIPADHREGVHHAWQHELTRIRAAAERRARA
jgi:hypothetical protein